MTKPKRTIKFRSKYTGTIHDTKEAAIRDNWLYLNNPGFRVGVKQDKVKRNTDVDIPFIPEKKITLSNAGLATGAVLSENMLDSIAKYADRAGLPVKTALGLATKETTLGNPTIDKSVYKLLGDGSFVPTYNNMQNINSGISIGGRYLISYNQDTNPYTWLLNAARKSKNFNETILKGEKYADKQAEKLKGRENTTTLEAGFRSYAEHPERYNPGQKNYQQLVNKRANEVWNSPEIQNWYKTYRKRSLEEGGK